MDMTKTDVLLEKHDDWIKTISMKELENWQYIKKHAELLKQLERRVSELESKE